MPDNDVADPEPITSRLPRLRFEHDRISAENLAFEARSYMPNGKLSTSTVQKIETDPDRRPQIAFLEAISRVLGVNPRDFPEYSLAQARRLLDEREVGLDEALTNLAAVESVLLSREEGDETPSPTLRGKGGQYAPAEQSARAPRR